jgi:hypothetical protein
MTTDKNDDCVVFYLAPDPDEKDPLLRAHNEEAEKQGAEFWNYVNYQDDGEIMSKTNRVITSIMKGGKVRHHWEPYDQPYDQPSLH